MSKKDGAPKSRAVRRILYVILALAIAAAAFTAGWLGRYYAIDSRMRTLMWAMDTLEDNYYRDFDEDSIYRQFFAALRPDPYSRFYTKSEYEKIRKESEGSNSDTGVAVTEEDGKPVVFSVVGNSTADNAGVRRGMYILGFGATAETVKAGTKSELSAFVSGHSGSFILRCGFQKDGTDARDFTVESTEYLAAYCTYRDSDGTYAFRGKDELKLEKLAGTLEGADADTAYIRIDEFNGNVATEFLHLLRYMKERGRTNLVLDLRSNGGGYLNDMVAIASHLMKDAPSTNAVVATAKYRGGREENYAASMTDFTSYFTADSRIKILADENTASASECLIGAMVEYNTVGYGDILLRSDGKQAKTYGKGIMQSHFTDRAGNVMKLTVATVHWPVTGKCIHDVGVTPDDGATGVAADLLFTESNDVMLSAALKALSS